MATARRDAPDRARLRQRLLYGLSLPERAARSAAGVVGGTLRDSAQALLPEALRNAKTYQVFVGQMLDFLAEDVGRVGAPPTIGDDGYLARKAAGNFIDVASIATLHLSPMLLLAVIGDVAYGSKAYLRELADELQRQGVVRDAAKIDDIDDLLGELAAASHETADLFDQPPLSIEGLKDTVTKARASFAGVDASKVISKDELAALWKRIGDISRRDRVSPLRVSGLVTLGTLEKIANLGDGALSSAQAVGTLFDRHVLDHYRAVVRELEEQGFYRTLAAFGKPYAQAAWRNFSPRRETLTERLADRATDRLLSKIGRRPAE